MEFYSKGYELLKICLKLIGHRWQQYHLSTNEYEVITTEYGRIRGVRRKNVYDNWGKYYAFEGIPYAKPPLGDLRFRAPEIPQPWNNILECTQYRSKPLQKHAVLKICEGSEDCLYLNVYSKQLNCEPLFPVMVFIYGGGFQTGEASRDIYAPDYFMSKNIILVTISYRCGPLGFLSFNDRELNIPGNAGLKDQIMALQWIKRNIHNFNGDPNNITLFGESAGAVSTHILMLSERTKGLFHKAILQSGAALCSWAIALQNNWPYRLANLLGYNGENNDKNVFEFLSKINGKYLIDSHKILQNKEEFKKNILFPFAPVIEPYITKDCVISKPIEDLLSTAWSNTIPVIIGSTSFEGLYFYTFVQQKPYIINELDDCSSVLMTGDLLPENEKTPNRLHELGLRLKEIYFGIKEPNINTTLFEYLDLISYSFFLYGIHRTIKARSKYATHALTYCYRFDFDSLFFNHFRILNCGSQVRGVCHADDLSYLFYNVMASCLSPLYKEYQIIECMIDMWYNFALNSNPNCTTIQPIVWEPIENKSKQQHNEAYKCLNISDIIDFIPLPEYNKLRLWDDIYNKHDDNDNDD